ncbi:MAG: hypothetical protein AAFX52_09420 [Pseudomonadota bacterium]
MTRLNRARFGCAGLVALATALGGVSAPSAWAQSDVCEAAGLPLQETVRIDTLIGVDVDAPAERPYLAGDGQSVIFESEATNIPALLPDGEALPEGALAGGFRQIYVMDIASGDVRIASVNDAGEPSNADCVLNEGALDHAGDVAVFECSGTNLLPGDEVDGNEADDIFAHFVNPVYGYQRGDTLRVTRAFDPSFDKTLDLGGEDANGSPQNGAEVASIAPFAPIVVFSSTARNMVGFDLGEPFPGVPNVQNYTFNLDTGVMELISVNDDGAVAPVMFTAAIDGDGDFVVSPSPSTNLRECDELPQAFQQRCENATPTTSIYSFDLNTQDAEDVSTARFNLPQRRVGLFCTPLFEIFLGFPSPFCGSLSPDLSYDGRYVVFDSTTPNFPDRARDFNRTVDVYAYDFLTDEFMLVSRVPGTNKAPSDFEGIEFFTAFSDGPEIAGDGRWVIYRSSARELTGGETGFGFFLADLTDLNAVPETVSVPPTGGEPFSKRAGTSFENDMPNLSAGGEIAAFSIALLKDDPAEGEPAPSTRDVPGYLRCLR